MKKLRVQFSKCAGAPDRFHGSGRRVDGKMVLSRQNPEPFDVVGMFMGHENPLQILRRVVKTVESFFHLFAADPRATRTEEELLPM